MKLRARTCLLLFLLAAAIFSCGEKRVTGKRHRKPPKGKDCNCNKLTFTLPSAHFGLRISNFG